MTIALCGNSVVVASGGLLSRDLETEIALYDSRSKQFYSLAGVGTEIWRLIQSPMRISDIGKSIVREYDVEPDHCEHDVLELLTQLVARELIEVDLAPRRLEDLSAVARMSSADTVEK